ncbi:MAG TPA: type II toxin-antitoxin system RelE/ParE family toxin [Planctomycetaceae bacterium]|nr:type II toxin-antitoxin system RelE/ParE family toxin [Planctomycetaceae bacterium]HQZ63502.1 type II toxin-antitoxin system RelE/ParE family toxin [Planctomycetaceae bacterium]
MSFWLNVTNQARDDITHNAAWWAETHSLDEALKWYDSVYEQLNELLAFPESHGLAAENDSFPYELREMLVGGKKRTYRAIFTIAGSEVRVLTVRRAAQRAITPSDI